METEKIGLDKIEFITSALSRHAEEIQALDSQRWHDIQGFLSGYKQTMENCLREGRKIKIGVIGQIKTGKSSFLNELLFDGQVVLPTAATPMTAALTELVFGERFTVELTYYTRDEWGVFERHAEFAREKYRQKMGDSSEALSDEKVLACLGDEISIVQKAAIEQIVAAGKIKGGGIQLGKIESFSYDSLKEIQDAMNDFVGVSGKKTPVVKSCKLMLNLPQLQHVDIVDTPGMNDPIYSRGMKAKECLRNCDAVFFLIRMGRFLDVTDMDLLRTYIPGEGIRAIHLVASRYDSGLIAEAKRFNGDLGKTCEHLDEVLAEQVERLTSEAEDPASILYGLKGIKALPVSGYLWNIARKIKSGKEGEIEKETAHKLNQLQSRFPSTLFGVELLEDLSGMPKAQECLKRVQDDKTSIMKKKMDDFEREKPAQFETFMRDLRHSVEARIKLLDCSDIGSIKEKMETLSRKVKACEKKICRIFDDVGTDIRRRANDVIDSVEDSAKGAVEINARQISESREEGCFCWKKTKVYHHTTADSYEAVDKLVAVGAKIRREVKEQITSIYGKEFKRNLEDALIQSIVDQIDTGSVDFDQDTVLGPLRTSINKLSVKRFEFDDERYSQIIANKFSGTVTGEEQVDALRKLLRDAILKMRKAGAAEVTRYVEEATSMFDEVGKTFADEIVKTIKADHDSLAAQLKDKSKTKEKYQDVLRIISEI